MTALQPDILIMLVHLSYKKDFSVMSTILAQSNLKYTPRSDSWRGHCTPFINPLPQQTFSAAPQVRDSVGNPSACLKPCYCRPLRAQTLNCVMTPEVQGC